MSGYARNRGLGSTEGPVPSGLISKRTDHGQNMAAARQHDLDFHLAARKKLSRSPDRRIKRLLEGRPQTFCKSDHGRKRKELLNPEFQKIITQFNNQPTLLEQALLERTLAGAERRNRAARRRIISEQASPVQNETPQQHIDMIAGLPEHTRASLDLGDDATAGKSCHERGEIRGSAADISDNHHPPATLSDRSGGNRRSLKDAGATLGVEPENILIPPGLRSIRLHSRERGGGLLMRQLPFFLKRGLELIGKIKRKANHVPERRLSGLSASLTPRRSGDPELDRPGEGTGPGRLFRTQKKIGQIESDQLPGRISPSGIDLRMELCIECLGFIRTQILFRRIEGASPRGRRPLRRSLRPRAKQQTRFRDKNNGRQRKGLGDAVPWPIGRGRISCASSSSVSSARTMAIFE